MESRFGIQGHGKRYGRHLKVIAHGPSQSSQETSLTPRLHRQRPPQMGSDHSILAVLIPLGLFSFACRGRPASRGGYPVEPGGISGEQC